jgi:hypothetical protein
LVTHRALKSPTPTPRLTIRLTPHASLGLGGLVAGSDVGPVDDVPDGADVARADVLVLEVVRVLPHVNAQERYQAGGRLQGILVRARGHLEGALGRVVPEPAPPGALDGDRRGRQAGLELVEAPKLRVNGLPKRARRRAAAPGRRRGQVAPEDGVVQVPAAVELDGLPERDDGADVARGLSGEGGAGSGERRAAQRGTRQRRTWAAARLSLAALRFVT